MAKKWYLQQFWTAAREKKSPKWGQKTPISESGDFCEKNAKIATFWNRGFLAIFWVDLLKIWGIFGVFFALKKQLKNTQISLKIL